MYCCDSLVNLLDYKYVLIPSAEQALALLCIEYRCSTHMVDNLTTELPTTAAEMSTERLIDALIITLFKNSCDSTRTYY